MRNKITVYELGLKGLESYILDISKGVPHRDSFVSLIKGEFPNLRNDFVYGVNPDTLELDVLDLRTDKVYLSDIGCIFDLVNLDVNTLGIYDCIKKSESLMFCNYKC